MRFNKRREKQNGSQNSGGYVLNYVLAIVYLSHICNIVSEGDGYRARVNASFEIEQMSIIYQIWHTIIVIFKCTALLVCINSH